MTRTVVVIGGGVVGASVAYHLSERIDGRVVLYEQSDSLPGATTGKSSLGFRQYAVDREQVQMRRRGKRLYNDFLAETTTGGRFVSQPFVEVATTESGAAAVRETLRRQSAAGSSAAEYLDGDQVRETVVAPELETSAVVGAAYRPNAGFFDSPGTVTGEFANRAVENGVSVETGVRVSDLVTADGRVTGVRADGSVLEAEAVVSAAGPWNLRLARQVGVDLPVRHTPVPIVAFESGVLRGGRLPRIVHHESGTVFRGTADGGVLNYHPGPEPNKYEVGEEFDPDDFDARVTAEHRQRIREIAEVLVPALADAEIVSTDTCLLSRTPDGNPVVGWTPVEGFSIAALASKGVQYAPAVGHVVATQLVEGDPTDLYDHLSITRFAGYDDCRTVERA